MKYEKMMSVAILTYDHVQYIEQAIKGVLMQKTTYDYEILIADDYSTDGTREIIKKYRDMYPDKIKLILQEKNVGAVKNQVSLLGSCKGKYISILDGDDYWTNPEKIQMQVDYLENHPECSACYCDADVIGDDFKLCTGDLDDYKYFYDNDPVFATGAFVIRNFYLNTDDLKYYHTTKIITDRITISLALKYGKIGYIDKKVSVYRRRKNENSYTSQPFLVQCIDGLDCLIPQYELVDDDIKVLVKEKRLKTAKFILKRALEDREYSMLFDVFFNKLTADEKVKIVTDEEIKNFFIKNN